MIPTWIYYFFVAAVFGITTVTGTITCNATYLSASNQAQITCFFGGHVSSETHQAFSVVHYSSNMTGGLRYVLECYFQVKTDNFDCIVHPSYTFNYTVNDQLILQIPNATSVHVGTYACHLIATSKISLPCSLSLTVAEILDEISTASRQQDGKTTNSFSTAQLTSEKIISELSIYLGIFLIVCATAFIFLQRKCVKRRTCIKLCTRHQASSQKNPSDSSQSEIADPKDERDLKATIRRLIKRLSVICSKNDKDEEKLVTKNKQNSSTVIADNNYLNLKDET